MKELVLSFGHVGLGGWTHTVRTVVNDFIC